MLIKKMGIILIFVMSFSLMIGCNKNEDEVSIPKSFNKFDETKIEGLTKQTIEKASYNASVEPKELNLEESREYVMENTSSNIVEVKRVFLEDFGVTEVMYEDDSKVYEVRYMHPKIDYDELREETEAEKLEREENQKDDTSNKSQNDESKEDKNDKKDEDLPKYDIEKTNGIWIYEYM